MERPPAVAGQFYEGDFELLNKQIEDCFYSKKGPGDLPVKRSEHKKLFGIIAPHAGYIYSGACAAWAYKEIAESHFPRTFVILGPNHYEDETGISNKDWITPLGLVRTDHNIVESLVKEGLKIEEECHTYEHSIEVQLPFLQFANRDNMLNIRAVEIAIGHDVDFRETAKKIYNATKDKDVSFIISSDFTHYGSNFHYAPFSMNIPEQITELDKGAIDLILKLDTEGFKDYINKTGVTICGFMPILIFLAMIGLMEHKPKSELLMHYMSGDLTKDYKNTVSYVSMAFR